MLGAIVRKEFVSTLRDGRLLVLGLLLCAVFVGFLLASSQQVQLQRQEKQSVGATAKEQWNSQSVKNPHAAAHYGIYVFKPDSPLAALEPGLLPFTGQALWLEPHKRNLGRFTPSADRVVAGNLGETGAGFVLYALLPLLVVALSFNSVSQEREQGTLRMLHSLGVAGRPLLFGKLLGLMAAFLLALSPALALAMYLLNRGFSLGGDDLIRLAAMLLLLGGYYAIFAALSLAASASCKTSRNALFLLLGFWLCSVFVASRLGAALADAVAPNPSAEQFWQAIKTDIDQGMPGDGDKKQRAQAFEAEILAKYAVGRKEDLPVGFVSLSRQHNDHYSSRVHQVHFDRLRDNFARQQRWMHLASCLGPSLAWRSLSMALAGTDLAQQRDFEDAGEAYRQYFIELTEDWDRQRSHGTDRSAKANQDDWRSVKDFTYKPPAFDVALARSGLDLGVLAAWLALSLILLAASAKRLAP